MQNEIVARRPNIHQMYPFQFHGRLDSFGPISGKTTSKLFYVLFNGRPKSFSLISWKTVIVWPHFMESWNHLPHFKESWTLPVPEDFANGSHTENNMSVLPWNTQHLQCCQISLVCSDQHKRYNNTPCVAWYTLPIAEHICTFHETKVLIDNNSDNMSLDILWVYFK